MKLLKLLPLLLLIGCSTDDLTDECGCTKTTYERYVENNHLTFSAVSTIDVPCQDEGSEDIDNTRFYTIRCN